MRLESTRTTAHHLPFPLSQVLLHHCLRRAKNSQDLRVHPELVSSRNRTASATTVRAQCASTPPWRRNGSCRPRIVIAAKSYRRRGRCLDISFRQRQLL